MSPPGTVRRRLDVVVVSAAVDPARAVVVVAVVVAGEPNVDQALGRDAARASVTQVGVERQERRQPHALERQRDGDEGWSHRLPDAL
jgi:hypothetical protein